MIAPRAFVDPSAMVVPGEDPQKNFLRRQFRAMRLANAQKQRQQAIHGKRSSSGVLSSDDPFTTEGEDLMDDEDEDDQAIMEQEVCFPMLLSDLYFRMS
jgi:hypothetical protein